MKQPGQCSSSDIRNRHPFLLIVGCWYREGIRHEDFGCRRRKLLDGSIRIVFLDCCELSLSPSQCSGYRRRTITVCEYIRMLIYLHISMDECWFFRRTSCRSTDRRLSRGKVGHCTGKICYLAINRLDNLRRETQSSEKSDKSSSLFFFL